MYCMSSQCINNNVYFKIRFAETKLDFLFYGKIVRVVFFSVCVCVCVGVYMGLTSKQQLRRSHGDGDPISLIRKAGKVRGRTHNP